jgi:TonB family protein
MMRIAPLLALPLFAAATSAVPAPAAPIAPAEPEPAASARARANLATLFSDGDYPAAAIRNHEQGPVAFSLSVGADGRATACSVTGSSGSAILDSTTCRLLMERARFEPARDSTGKPTTDTVAGRIIWRLPDDGVPPRLQLVQMLWTSCVMGEAAKLVPGDLAADEIARRSFPPCAALEALVAREVKAPVPLEAREAMTRSIEQSLAMAREQLKTPSESAAPQD